MKSQPPASSTTAHVDTFARDNLPPLDQWPDITLDLPELAYPARLNCAVELLDRNVIEGRGEQAAIHATGPDGTVITASYRQVLARANQIARVLRDDLGLVPGTRILLRGPNNPMMATCWFAVIKAGCIAVATMPLLRAKELQPVIDRAAVTIALCDSNLRDEMERVQAVCPSLQRVLYFNGNGPDSLEAAIEDKPVDFENIDTALDDVALIAFTSGTTGQPKGTLHFHRDVMAMCDLFPRSCLKPTADDIFCGTPPLAFTFGLGGMLCFPFRFGASTVLSERLTPQSLLETIARHRASIVFTAPTFYRMMAPLVSGHDLSSLRKAVSAGEALPDATRQLFKDATGIEILDGLGATEMIHIFVSHTEQSVRRGATGHAIRGYQVAVLDDDGRPCPPGTVGRLAVRGATGCRYLADPRQADYVQNGWNITGDAYRMDEDGYLYYEARIDDMIISAGYNIAGPEVEGALLMHPAVAECGVVGKPDVERGQIVMAFVVLKDGHIADAAMARSLQGHVKATVAPYKYPREGAFVAALPRTETGKVQRFRLRQMAAGGA